MTFDATRLKAAVLTLTILACIAAFPFHLLADHSEEAERGVCAVCIALTRGIAPSDTPGISAAADVTATGLPQAAEPLGESTCITLEAPRGPPPSLA